MVRVLCGLVALGLLMPVSAQAKGKGSQYYEWQTGVRGTDARLLGLGRDR